MSKVLVITTSLRANSNSDILAERLIAGAKDAGHEVELISLKGKDLGFCIGCLACQTTLECVQKDDAVRIAEQVKDTDTLVFATPIYYYEMSGQMKTMIDRANSLYPRDYKFRDVYMLTTAAEDEDDVDERAVAGLQGWVDCFAKAEFKGKVFAGGVNDPDEIKGHKALEEAYEMGKAV